jgi:hypothetical protein
VTEIEAGFSAPDLTPEEWQYISILIAHDVERDVFHDRRISVAKHQPIWEKIQPACEWEGESQ